MKNRGTKLRTVVISLAVAAGTLMAMPMASPAFDLPGDLTQVTQIVDETIGGALPGAGGGQTATPRSGTPPNYVPPQHGTNPHGQGTVGVVDLQPETAPGPLSGDPAGGDPMSGGEDVVVGRSRGEQNADGSYHGRIVVAALFGQELLGVETNEGESAQGPLQPLQTQLLDAICSESGQSICVSLLTMSSTTNGSGSSNHFEAVGVHLSNQGSADQRIDASAASSNGNISDDGNCQTAHGDSYLADASVGGGVLTAEALRSSSDAQACNGGSISQTNSSSQMLADVQGNDVGCADSDVNHVVVPASPLLAVVCAANESNDAQALAPQGVREALTVFILDAIPLVKLTAAASESRAAAPGSPLGGPGGNPRRNRGCTGDDCVSSRGKSPSEGGDDSAASQARAGKGTLPFTGTQVLLVAMIGCWLLSLGFGVRAAASSPNLNR